MNVRFHQSFTLFPGVRLNVGKAGISASIGVPGATLNLGGNGIRTTIGAPGTGLSVSKLHPWGGTGAPTQNPSLGQPMPVPTSEAAKPIASAAVEKLTSASMLEVQALLKQAKNQSVEIKRKLKEAEDATGKAEVELRRRTGSLFRFFYKKRIEALSETVPELKAQVVELQAWEADARVDVTFESSDEAKKIYGELVRAFGALQGVARSWDITAESAINRVKARSYAERGIDRQPARLFLSSSTYIRYENSALVFENKNGEDIYIYPGVAVMERNDGAFALIDLRDLHIEYANVNFVEDAGVPHDTYVIKYTWAKVNKNGSPDLRFKDNYQIPICQYGQLVLRSKSGVREEYQFSTTKQPREFAEAFNRFKAALSIAEKSIPEGSNLPKEKRTFNGLMITPTQARKVDGTTQVNFNFQFRCRECGDHMINTPDDRSDDGEVSCSGCGRHFGAFGDLRDFATQIGLRDLADGKIKLSPMA